ncbi:carbohydrate ABC transporter permease [Aquitalea sp.]|jgi:ABC-type glycerol-3-phosphate transport system permease component|uniref:carbohydrate ABC transporter permease n=1 Tax=Aquitalea sp. TaxID=1872623 RepID=UPI00258E4F02|nr:carbohydrate ABC transporter permease [Aquitalea sp.]
MQNLSSQQAKWLALPPPASPPRWGKALCGLALALLWLLPFSYVLLAIFKSTAEYAASAPLSLPEGVSPLLENIRMAWQQGDMAQAMLNSSLYAAVGASLAVLLAAMAAYPLARMHFRHRNLWFLLLFAGTVFPFQMYLIPLFFGFQWAELLDTHLGMCLLYTAICIPFPLLVLRNYMQNLSLEIDQAARLDGASEFILFWRIILPNLRGPMSAVFLLQFTWIWNDMLFSSVLGNSPETRSIMNALLVFQGSYAQSGPNIMLTAAVLASLPTLLLFVLLRRQFMQGLRV